MNQPTTMQKLGVTPAKLALVGVLGVVLLAVVVPQLRSESPLVTTADSSSQQKDRKARLTRLKENNKQPSSERTTEDRPPQVWPVIPLGQVVEYDPLAKPMWFVNARNATEKEREIAATNENLKTLEELEKQGASIVVISNRDSAATIGEQQVRVGDRIKGFEVSDITTEGVVLIELRTH
ncbi:MAG: hypothetical protein MI725_14820 [Pirellulales bacterium]|nr:hypothetical protein [Pirellulales bacterium]